MKNKIEILIVEDEAIIAEDLKYSLEDLGYNVVASCYTFEEATAAIAMNKYDLVMLDVNLGNKDITKDGFALARIINENYHIPFIFITAYNDLDTIEAASKLRPYGYLIKPVNKAVLFATVQLAIERFDNKTAASKPDNQLVKPEYFFVKMGSKTHKVSWDDVYCLEAGKNYVKLRSKSTSVSYPIRGSLAYVINNLLPPQLNIQFIKVNRSYYLNISYITRFDNQYIYCEDEKFENSIHGIRALQNMLNR